MNKFLSSITAAIFFMVITFVSPAVVFAAGLDLRDFPVTVAP